MEAFITFLMVFSSFYAFFLTAVYLIITKKLKSKTHK